MSQLKAWNGTAWELIGTDGIGVPSGGTTGQVLKKLSNSDYYTGWETLAELPSVTLSDNGKVLRVVNGAWAAVSLPSANGVSF